MQALPMTSAQALGSTRSGPITIGTSPVLTKPLESWLLVEASDEVAIATIARSELLRSEAAMVLPALRQAAMSPATPAEIKGIIGSRFATYPQPQRTEGEAAAFWADYVDALQGLPASAVEAGMAAHVKDPASEFLPKPGKLASLAKSAPSQGRWFKALARARQAVERSRASAPPRVIDRPSREQFEAQMADFRAQMATKEPPKPQVQLRPTPCAAVDENGISAEARALLARQRTASTQTALHTPA